jgi:TonB family protein
MKYLFESMLSILMLASLPGLFSCTATQSSLADKKNYTENDDKYKTRYAVKFNEDEKPLRYGYYYIVSKVPEGYRVRVFNPDKKILTEDKIYSTSALTLPHGFYESWWDDGSIHEQGIYQYGRKQSVWLESEPDHGKSISGAYLNSRREGVWTQLDSSGMIESVYNYKDGKRYGKFFLYDASGMKINEGLYRNDTLLAEVVKQPVTIKPYLKSCQADMSKEVHVCSDAALEQYIYSTLHYPTRARQLKIEGTAIAQWDVMADGSVKNIRVPQALSDDIETETLKVLKKMPEWMPATKDGVPIKYTVTLPINFKL